MPKTRRDVKPWQDEETLRWAYHEKHLSQDEAGHLLGCSGRTVGNWMFRNDIEARFDGGHGQKRDISKEKVEELFVDQEMSPSEVAEALDRSESNIQEYIHAWGLKAEVDGPYDCPQCQFSFNSEKAKNTHCANVHGEYTAQQAVPCDNCGEQTTKYKSEMGRYDYHYCSPECRENHQSTLPPEEQPAWNGGKVTVECAYCGTEKKVTPSRVEQTDNFFCDGECYGNYKSSENSHPEPNTYTGPNHPQWNSIEIECDWCGGTDYKPPARIERSEQDFCSPECHNKWMAENQVGPAHHQWEGGRLDYGKGWTPKKRRKVRSHADFQCEDCGMPQEDHLDWCNRKLHVHHVIPARQFDDPEKRNAVSNLVALCIPCHRKWESMPGLRPDTREQPAD
jgi:transposase